MTLGNILLLLAFQLAGEFLHRVMHVPLSGPLLGMALLLLALVLWGGPSPGLQDTTRPLLASLALLFVPAGVGVVLHLDVLAADAWPIGLAVLAGTLIAVGTTGLVAQRLLRR